MTWKKILSAILIGTFMIGVPAANFDAPLTQTVSAKAKDKDYEKVKKNYESKRSAYERAKKFYDEARRSGKDIKFRRAAYEAARKDYQEARSEYSKYDDYESRRYEREYRRERARERERERDRDYTERRY